MASPWKRGSNKPGHPATDDGHWGDDDQFGSYADPPHSHSAVGGGEDEWALLRATPDYDSDEMSAVGTYLQPSPAVIAAAHAPPVIYVHPHDAVPSGWDAEALAFAERPAEGRWPEAGSVAGLALALIDGGGKTGDATWHAGAASGDAWSRLPDPIGADGRQDLLATALAVGERAGLLDGTMPTTGGAGSAPPTSHAIARAPERQGERGDAAGHDAADLLDKALAAGQRAGLMDRWG